MAQPQILFVTGKLAEPALRRTLATVAPGAGFDFGVAVLPITVAALATTQWIRSHLTVPAGIDRLILPGLCPGDLSVLSSLTSASVERGPDDLRDIPEFFGKEKAVPAGYGAYDITILAEVNHVQRLGLAEIRRQARVYRDAGADIIDLGCDPGETWTGVGDAVRALRDDGMRVSIDTFNPHEAAAAVTAGAELVLSVNATNREQARSWGCEVVAIPDTPGTLDGLDRTVEMLHAWNAKFRIDPVLEPIGFGFAASLDRYLEARRRYPAEEMLMGVGNLTELTDMDSAAANVLLLGFCQELGIRSVLTTQVINWCRSAVEELDRARRLVHYACRERTLPKHLAPELVLLRDPRLRIHGEETLSELAARLTDPNFRIFAEREQLHVMSSDFFVRGTDPFALFEQMLARRSVTPEHAFYLGYEMAKAVTALTLGKNYVQDQALRWGFLTVSEAERPGKMTNDPEEKGQK